MSSSALYGQDFTDKISPSRQNHRQRPPPDRHKGIPYMTQLENRVIPKSYIHGRGSVHAPGDEVFPGIPHGHGRLSRGGTNSDHW